MVLQWQTTIAEVKSEWAAVIPLGEGYKEQPYIYIYMYIGTTLGQFRDNFRTMLGQFGDSFETGLAQTHGGQFWDSFGTILGQFWAV